MFQKIIQVLVIHVVLTAFLSTSYHSVKGKDEDESFSFANGNNNKFFFNTLNNCPPNYYFDVDFFKCRLCDGNFHLMTNDLKNQCLCDRNSHTIFEYDNILRRPICEKKTEVSSGNKCQFYFVNATKFSSVRKSVRVYRLPNNDENCFCDSKTNENYRGTYCIKSDLFKDLKGFKQYKNLPLSHVLNLDIELKFIVFFCKILHRRDFCNYLANLCTLTNYNLEQNGPCQPFYQQQTQLILIEQGGNEFDGGEKMKPFLFFRSRKANKNLLDKFIDFSYRIDNENINSTINFTIINYDLQGNLSEMRLLKLSDLNLCANKFAAFPQNWQQNIKFARNFYSKCTLNLRELIAFQPDTKFSTLYLNHYENQANFLQTVPVLIRNAFKGNKNEDIEKWQLVKRFFLVDTVTGRNQHDSINDNYGDHETKFYEQFSQITYVKSIEIRFQLNSPENVADDDKNSDEINKIGIPLIVLEYGTLNLTQIDVDDDRLYNVDFSFKIRFTKRPNLNFFFQIILPILILLAFFYSLMCTFFYKIKQQKIEYDLSILLNLTLNLFANISNALFIFILILIAYVYFIYKTQSSVVKIMLPLEREESMLGILLVFAIIFKIIKMLSLFAQMTKLDLFFIDWERPKTYNTSDHFLHGSNKSHPGTPSIASSFKPTLSSPSPTNIDNCVSAWRNYFVANEWQELITKRKISVYLHVVFMIAVMMLFGFENLASNDFNMCLNVTHFQNYLNQYRLFNEAADIVDENIMMKVATGALVYFVLYSLQRVWNFLVYERFIDNCLQQFIDVASIANISVLILIKSYGFYIHGRSVHGRSDIDTFNMILQFKREEENLCGNRGLIFDQQTYTVLAPRNLRLFYEKIILPISENKSHYHQQFSSHLMKADQNFEKTMLIYHNINRFFAAFIDHALKDIDYVIKEKNLFEKWFDCELESNVNNDSKGVFYFDNGHSFDQVLFYGNENSIFGFEFLLFIFLLFTTGSFLIAILSIGIVFKLIALVINHLTKNNLARKTLIDKRFLI